MSQRRNYIIDRSMQSRFTMTLLMLIFLIAAISFCNLYVIGSFVINNYSNLEDTNNPYDFIAKAMQIMWPRLILIIVVNVIIVIIIGVFYSHQFAGPSFKMERSLREIAAGDLSTKIYLRQSDSLHNIADAINQLIDHFRTVVKKTNELSIQAKDNLDKIESDDDNTKKRVAALRGITDEIDDLFNRFTLDQSPSTKPDEVDGEQ